MDAAPGHLHLFLPVLQKYFGLTDQFQLSGGGLPGEAQLLVTDLERLSHEEVFLLIRLTDSSRNRYSFLSLPRAVRIFSLLPLTSSKSISSMN